MKTHSRWGGFRLWFGLSLASLHLLSPAYTNDFQSCAESPPSLRRLDSLWIRASSGEERFRNQVEPCKRALIAMGDTAVPYLISKLTTSDAREALTLEQTFEGIGSPAVPALCAELSKKDIWILRNIGRALAAIKDKRAVQPLLTILHNPDQGVRSQTCTALGKIADTSATLTVIPMLNDSAETVRKSAAVALGTIADVRSLEPLITALDDRYYGARFMAAEGLIRIGSPAVKPLLLRFASLTPRGKWLALSALGKLKDPRAESLLFSQVNHPDPLIRAFAIDGLADLGTKKTNQYLKTARDNDLFVQTRITIAQQKLVKTLADPVQRRDENRSQ